MEARAVTLKERFVKTGKMILQQQNLNIHLLRQVHDLSLQKMKEAEK